jgi:protocatechuate 3,4-dioxygenase beta subunit
MDHKVKLNWIYRCGLQPTFNTINPSPYSWRRVLLFWRAGHPRLMLFLPQSVLSLFFHLLNVTSITRTSFNRRFCSTYIKNIQNNLTKFKNLSISFLLTSTR